MSGAESRALGRWGEAQAADWLEKRGCVLVAANWRCRFGEIDLIAEDGDFLCFVEVKLRSAGSIGLPREFVDARKRERLRAAASAYLSAHDIDAPARFDVAEVYQEPDGTLRLEYLENAFE